VLTVLLLIGCQPASNGGQPLLTDPSEVVMAAVRSTAGLHSVHARMEMTIRGGAGQGIGGPAMNGRMAFDVDVDLDTRSFAGRTVVSMAGMPDMTSDMILVGGQQFTRTAPATRWTQMPQFGPPVQFPANEQLVEGISTVIQGAGVDLQLTEPEPCGEATCYHVIASVDPATEWQLLASLSGGVGGAPAGAVGAGAAPAGLNLPPLTLHLLVDQATRALVGANTSITFQGIATAMTITLTNPDAEIHIAAPPRALIDQMNNGFFGGGVITTVGGEVAPVPVESLPPVGSP
jgi:hypothetical protein